MKAVLKSLIKPVAMVLALGLGYLLALVCADCTPELAELLNLTAENLTK